MLPTLWMTSARQQARRDSPQPFPSICAVPGVALMSAIDRRAVLRALVVTAAGMATGRLSNLSEAGAQGAVSGWSVQTLEAFADTLIPGERRFPADVPIAGVVSGPGAVQAGAVAVLASPQLPLAPWLDEITALLNARAIAYAAAHLLVLPITSPALVGLSFRHRTDLVRSLFGPDDVDRPIWQVLSLLVSLAFDTAAHLDTGRALSLDHPGLSWIGFPAPDPDGLWRFPHYSYGRALSDLHPATTPSGSPA
ncbi:DUF5987 family protein [Streptomyces sp. NPDC053431]|uniref:DUF5987 family protein n=1 Tax=Streptomyces sp. NPDC053431 TaxID=3365703 RepID=UPI0037D1711D